MKVGNWNIRTLYRSGNVAQAAQEMSRKGIDIISISETYWMGKDQFQLADGETFIYSGREDNNHGEGVDIDVKKCGVCPDGMGPNQRKDSSYTFMLQRRIRKSR